MFQDIPYGRRRYVRKLLCRRDYYGLDLRSKPPVGIGDGPFILEVEHVADAPDYVRYAMLAAGIDGQFVIFDDFDALHAADSLAYDVHSLVHGEETALILVDADCDDDFVEHCQRPAEYVQMACGKRIEGSRK